MILLSKRNMLLDLQDDEDLVSLYQAKHITAVESAAMLLLFKGTCILGHQRNTQCYNNNTSKTNDPVTTHTEHKTKCGCVRNGHG